MRAEALQYYNAGMHVNGVRVVLSYLIIIKIKSHLEYEPPKDNSTSWKMWKAAVAQVTDLLHVSLPMLGPLLDRNLQVTINLWSQFVPVFHESISRVWVCCTRFILVAQLPEAYPTRSHGFSLIITAMTNYFFMSSSMHQCHLMLVVNFPCFN